MEFQNNWVVPVLHDGPHKRKMIDPSLKVQLLVSYPRQDPGEELWEVIIHYDPQMNADSLVAEMTPQEIADDYFRIVPERPMKVVESSEKRKILEILFVTEIANNADGYAEILLKRRDFGRGFAADAGLLEKENILSVSDHPYDFILHVLQSYVLPKFWDEYAKKQNERRPADSQIKRVTVLLGEMMASQIAQHTGKSLPPPQDGYVTIATREIEL
jgi:hypothetical protein